MVEPQYQANAEQAAVMEWVKIRTSMAHDVRATIAEVEKFEGKEGELAHFLKAGDRVTASIDAKIAAGWLDESEIPSLRAALTNRISRHVLNIIQCDEGTDWPCVKGRLKKAFGGARWAPEEDALRVFREVKGRGQSDGSFASRLLEGYATVAEKFGEGGNPEVTRIKMGFLEEILKVQLKRETGRAVPADKAFAEVAREIIDEDAKERAEGAWAASSRSEYKPHPRQDRVRRYHGEEAIRRDAPPRRRYETPTASRRDGERRGGRPRETPRARRSEERKCYECGSSRHLAARCPRRVCFECGREGHLAKSCPDIYRRSEVRGEPMEINWQKVGRKKQREPRSSGSSLASSDDGSESDGTTSSTWTRVEPRRKSGKPPQPAPRTKTA